jgi:hypothetical protein
LQFANETHVTILVTSAAGLVVDGKPATVADAERAIDKIGSQHGVVWYARENGDRDPTSAQMDLFKTVFSYVAKSQLPFRLFKDGTFTQLITP